MQRFFFFFFAKLFQVQFVLVDVGARHQNISGQPCLTWWSPWMTEPQVCWSPIKSLSRKSLVIYWIFSFQLFYFHVIPYSSNIRKLLIFKSMRSLFKGVNEPTVAFSLVNMSFKDVSQDVSLISLKRSCKANCPKAPSLCYTLVILLFSGFFMKESDPTWTSACFKSQGKGPSEKTELLVDVNIWVAWTADWEKFKTLSPPGVVLDAVNLEKACTVTQNMKPISFLVNCLLDLYWKISSNISVSYPRWFRK